MKSSHSIQLLDSQNNNISPITSIESLYFDACVGANGDYVRYRVFDRLPLLNSDGTPVIFKDSSSSITKLVTDVSTEIVATGPEETDISLYKLKYNYIPLTGENSFMEIVEERIDVKLDSYLDFNDVYPGDGIIVTPHMSADNNPDGVIICASVDNNTIIIDENGQLKASVTGIAEEFAERIETIESSIGYLESSVLEINNKVEVNSDSIDILNSSVNSIEEHLTVLDNSVNSLESSTAYMKEYIDFMFGGVTNWTSLSNIPATHQSVNISLSGDISTNQYLSLASLLKPGQDMNIRVFNNSDTNGGKRYKISLWPKPETSTDASIDGPGAEYYLMNGRDQYLGPQEVCEINVWRFNDGQDTIYTRPSYSIKYISKEY